MAIQLHTVYRKNLSPGSKKIEIGVFTTREDAKECKSNLEKVFPEEKYFIE